jgi:hypothetical protein
MSTGGALSSRAPLPLKCHITISILCVENYDEKAEILNF